MAGRLITASAALYLALFLHLVLPTECNYNVRFGDKARRLHLADDTDSPHRRPLIVDRQDYEETSSRARREAPNSPPSTTEFPNNNPNITTKVRTACARARVATNIVGREDSKVDVDASQFLLVAVVFPVVKA